MPASPADAPAPIFPLRFLKTEAVESRRFVRYSCNLEASCWPIGHPPSAELLPVRLLDLSAAGMGLLVNRCLPSGLFVVVQVPDAAGESSCMLLGRVVRSAVHGEGQWIIGCMLLGKIIHSTAVSSSEYETETLAPPGAEGADAAARNREALEEIKRQIQEQLQELAQTREAFLGEQQERRQALEQQAEELEARRGAVEKLETKVAQDLEQALPERIAAYVPRRAGSDTPLMPSGAGELEQLEAERDAALEELRRCRDETAAWESEKETVAAQERRLAEEGQRLQAKERELRLLETEMHEAVEIAERENQRTRAELAAERIYLARQREALRVEREDVSVESRRPRPGAAPAANGIHGCHNGNGKAAGCC